MTKPKLKIIKNIDADALEINKLHWGATAGSVLNAWDCGGRLMKKKAVVTQDGKWSDWVNENLEFSDSTAARYMQLYVSNPALTRDLKSEDAIALLRKLWGNSGRHDNLKGEYEWYTPEPIIQAAREVMGGIDLDPASCEHANKIVQATEYFTEKNDGLMKEWKGRVFINPPFAHPTVKYFADKLMESLGGGIEQAVWLSNACVDVVWWHQLAEIGTVCFHKGRIKFYGEEGDLQPPTLGQSIFYFGDNEDKFREIFSKFGVVLS